MQCKPDSIIYQGSKITYMEVKRGLNIRVVDSLKFLPMKLAKLSKAFGLKETKGWFPHLFNLQCNWNYVGKYPEAKFYGLERMNEDEGKDFIKWHTEKVNSQAIFDFQQALEFYCRSDVNILKQSCLLFRKLMIDSTTTKVNEKIQPGIDPWSEITIASVCSQIYRSKFLEEEWKVKINEANGVYDSTRWVRGKLKDGVLLINVSEDENIWMAEDQVDVVEKRFISSPLAQIPSGGYTMNDNYSKIAIVWLEWIMKQHEDAGNANFKITHALNGIEKRIPHRGPKGNRSYFRCDGFREEENGKTTVWEFLGCRTHGCPTCYTGENRHKILHPNTGQSMNQLYFATIKRQQYLEDLNHAYVSMWECDFRQQLRDNPELKKFAEDITVEERINLRESFKGGRTNAAKLYYKCAEGERINYIDFTSLYGYVNKYAEYPVGHPLIYTNLPENSKISDYFGIAKVTVRAPRRLLHPVLPVRIADKLMFPLCCKCAAGKNQISCSHTDSEREFVGTWCTPELVEAESKGYTILKIHELYHWEKTSKYSKLTGDRGLFADYVDTFLKLKQESSDWPTWCTDEKLRDEYINKYLEKEGIKLEASKVNHNPGLRSLAKLLLVNFWGKWGQRENQLQTLFIDNLGSLCQLMVDSCKKIHDFQLINDKVMLIQYQYVKEFGFGRKKSNIFIAAFTTCFARLKLYSELYKLGDRVIYYDTDSIIYVTRDGEYDPELGDYLGEFTNELQCKDVGCKDKSCTKRHYIVEFISAGPKNYSYQTEIGTTKCKVRGFTLNKCNSLKINFDFMRDMVTAPEGADVSVTVTDPAKITRHKTKSILYNRSLSKSYRMVYDKRAILPDYDTRPYGF